MIDSLYKYVTGKVFAVQSGAWITGRSWFLDSSTDSVTISGTIATTGGLTNTELRATPVPISLSSTTITGSVAVTGPLTDTQLRAALVPVSLTSTTITGSVAVTGTFFQAIQPVSQSGTWITARSWVLSSGTDSVTITGSITLPPNAATETTLNLIRTKTDNLDVLLSTRTKPADAQNIRNLLFASDKTDVSGSTLAATQSGVWSTGRTWTLASGTDSVNVGNFPAIQPVSQSGAWTVTANAGTNLNTSLLALDSTVAKDNSLTTINTSINTLLKPANTLAAVTTVGTITNVVYVEQIASTKQTYSASITGLIPAASATDIFTITGSGTKTIYVTKISISGTQTTKSFRDVLLIKRSAANSAGTSTSPTIIPHDSTNAAATAVVRAYTANPTLGAAVGTMKSVSIPFTVATPSNAQSNGDIGEYTFDYSRPNSQAIVLRGVAQVLAINLNSVSFTGGLLNLTIEYIEV